MILLFAAPPAAFADELPADAQAILDESGVDITDAAGWSLSDLCDTLGSWLAEGFQPALHFAAQAAGYLLLAGLLGREAHTAAMWKFLPCWGSVR